ncbi:MAG TPA: protein kinase family protein [Dermatophilaceae bacterium]
MQGVDPGTVLGSRYALRHRLSQGDDVERWSAHDTTLEREVTLTLVGTEHHNGAGVLDAARRAAGVEDTRLVRILDVGTHDGSSFIVEEAMSGSESLASLILQGPLPAEEARRIAGETAKGLEAAGVRGLHHLRLTPHHVLIAPDGSIRVSGVAVAASIEGSEDREPDSASALRRDAVSLVAIVYAALTTRWPLDQRIAGIGPAPMVLAGVAAPSEIVTGVPADLDTLCRLTLNEGAGPLTPGVVAHRIAPWAPERVRRTGVDPTVVLHLPDVVPDVVPVIAGVPDPAFATSTQQVPSPKPSRDPTVVAEQEDFEPHQGGQDSAAGPTTVGDEAAEAGAVTTRGFGTALASAGAAAGAVTSRLSSFARTTGGKNAQGQSGHGSQRMNLPVGLSARDDIGPPLPLLPASTALPPSRGQSKIVLLVVAAFVTFAMIIGYQGVVGRGGSGSGGTATPKRTVTVSAPAVTVPAPLPTPQAGAAGARPIAIVSATGFDPEGDQQENNSQAAHVYDGDPATTWSSERYSTAQFGNLKKGVGILLDLGQPTSVHQVTLELAKGPVDVTVYAATGPSLQGAAVVGSASAASGQVQLKAASAMPESQFIIVWFTSLAPDGSQFGASVSEIALR